MLCWCGCSRATNWAKFAATAGLGVIHRGHLSQARALPLSHTLCIRLRLRAQQLEGLAQKLTSGG
jgi:hypothetical protein